MTFYPGGWVTVFPLPVLPALLLGILGFLTAFMPLTVAFLSAFPAFHAHRLLSITHLQ